MQNVTGLADCWKQLGRSYMVLCTYYVFCKIKASLGHAEMFLAFPIEASLKTIAKLPMKY